MATTTITTQDKQPNIVPEQNIVREQRGEAAPKFTSIGAKGHGIFTFKVVDWLLNSGVGASTAYAAERTEIGKKYFTGPVSACAKFVLQPILRTPASLAEGAKWATKFAAIMMGGFIITPLILLLENRKNKVAIVKAADECWYGKEAVANDPKFAESYKEIAEEPKQSLAISMGARMLAIAPIVAMTSTPRINEQFIKYIYDPIGKAFEWTAARLGIRPSKSMLINGEDVYLKGNPNLPKEFQNNWDCLKRIVGFDVGLTLPYAILHEKASKSLAAIAEDHIPAQTTEEKTSFAQKLHVIGTDGQRRPADIKPKQPLTRPLSPLHAQRVVEAPKSAQLGVA